MADLSRIFLWWLYILLMGAVFLPFSTKLFRKFLDGGYIFSKPLGMAAASYAVWALSAMRILPFNRYAIFLILLAIAGVSAVSKGISRWKAFWSEYKRIIIIEEILFLLLLSFWSYVRGLQPDLIGLEKFMDFGFVNAMLRADVMPAVDMWLSGRGINYYYFGQFICAFMIKLSGIEASSAYNLMLSTIFALAFMLSFSLAAAILHNTGRFSLRKILIGAAVSACLLTFSGNLHTFIYAYAKPALPGNTATVSYFYPDSTRYIGYDPPTDDKTIHEFPFYSFVVADLHGHVSDIPFVLTVLAILYAYHISQVTVKKTMVFNHANFFVAFLLSIMYMTNAWDYPIYLTVALAVYLFKNASESKTLKTGVSCTVKQFLATILTSQLLMMPFTFNFENFTEGVGLAFYRTPLYQLLVLWGSQLFFAVSLILLLVRLGITYVGKLDKKQKNPAAIITNLLKSYDAGSQYAFILAACAIGLVLMPEVIYVKDIYTKGYHRANTMFKLTYQAFIMFSVMSGYAFTAVPCAASKRWTRSLLQAAFLVMIILPLLFPYWAVKGYYTSLSPSNYKGLYGLNYLNEKYPGDAEAVKWLNEYVKGQPVLLEADGDSYSDYGRISAATGLPTVLGWYVHEWLWRGSFEEPEIRKADVARIYESEDGTLTSNLIAKYNIRYIYIGDMERLRFPKLQTAKLLSLGKTVYSAGPVQIIEIAGQ